MYEIENDLVVSTNEGKDNENTDTRRYFPDFRTRCKKTVVSFDNINFRPFKKDPYIENDPVPGIDLVMDECPIDDDRQPIIAHMS